MPMPQGSVPALCAASATMFSLGIIFLGYWGLQEGGDWTLADKFVAGFAIIGFAFLGLVPWMATSPVAVDENDSKVRFARWMFLVGVISVWLAIVVSVIF
ncbi:hypothetical protein G3N95_20025 [Paraburkholderia sp. Tr-20389]|uniref:hypothetical protein n=1 Tax=Paraburkholderia sp. Tr-20389 TaxID=2703903 RepID=UPI00197D940F|nr:hypothetical protein [Paraburkholderia sp. Tr-20389]MBN3755244.1 hypothetical protein [Paraburkholderia sp. Tr-20389]